MKSFPIPEVLPHYQISYWQIGCNDAKSGKPFNKELRNENGYEQGYYWGQHGKSRVIPDPLPETEVMEAVSLADPPLKNPYMEGIESIEGILDRMRAFSTTFPAEMPREKFDKYLINLLRVRDELHACRLDELGDEFREARQSVG